MAGSDEFRTAPVVIAGIVGALLLFALTVGLTALFLTVEQEQAREKTRIQAPEMLRAEEMRQLEKLYAYRLVPGDGDVVRIPIDRAMELVVRELSR